MIRRLRVAGAEVSDWEGEFLDSIEGRVQTYGRAFGDPEKGAPGSALSIRQARKLKETSTKVQPTAETAPESEPSANLKTGATRMRPWRRLRAVGDGVLS